MTATTIEQAFDVDDADHREMRYTIADVIGERNGEALHPDPVCRADA